MDSDTNNQQRNPDRDLSRDLIMARIIDGEARPEDWRTFREMAAKDSGVWGELGEMQQQDEELAGAVRTLTDRAGDVDLPTHVTDRQQFESRLGTAARWGGWLVAASVLVAWGTGMRLGGEQPTTGVQPVQAGVSSMLAAMTPEERFNTYVEAGRQHGDVLDAVPEPVVLETRPIESGGVEVYVLRQVVERRTVENVYQQSVNEAGQRVELPARVVTPPRTAGSAF